MKIIIIGGSFAGIQAAMTCRDLNKDCEIIILEAAGDLLHYPVVFRSQLQVDDPSNLKTEEPITLAELTARDIDCLLNTTVTQINPEKKWLICEKPDGSEQLNYDYLVLAMGSQQYIGMKDAEIQDYIIRLDSYHHLDESLSLVEQAEKIIIIGGGQYGIEMSERYLKLGKQVTLLEAGEHLAFKLFDNWIIKDLEEDLLRLGLNLKCNESYQGLSFEDGELIVKSHRGVYPTDAIQFAMNVQPNTALIEAFLRLNPDGTIWTDENLQTSIPSIYACGDLIKWQVGQAHENYYLPLISHAKLSGRIVGMNICGHKQSIPTSPRAIRMTILDNDYFSCGKTLQELDYSQIDYHLSRYHHEGLSIQCLSQVNSGQILGIQIRGLKTMACDSLFTMALNAIQAGLTDQFLALNMNVYQGHQALLPNGWFDAMNQHWLGRQNKLLSKEDDYAN